MSEAKPECPGPFWLSQEGPLALLRKEAGRVQRGH